MARAAPLAVSLILVAAAGGCRRPANAVPAARPGPDLFHALAATFRHPRCLNCHGGIDPHDPKQHPPLGVGPYYEHTGIGCARCHDAARTQFLPVTSPDGGTVTVVDSGWHAPRPERSFTGRDDATLCAQVRDAFPGLPADTSDFLEHIDHDERIQLGFEGRRAIRARPVDAPPQTYAEFRRLAREWATVGQAACPRPEAPPTAR